MSDYATVADIQTLKRPLTASEQERAVALIPLVSSLIRYEAEKTGRNFDLMVYESELVPTIDAFEVADDEPTTITLSNTPVTGEVFVVVNGQEVTNADYALLGRDISFVDPIVGEILVRYDYRGLADVAKSVTCDVVMRELNTPGGMLPATSFSEGAGSVSQSFSLPNSSGAIKLWPSDLKALGLKRQKLDALNLMKPRRRC